jgi:hypothetical protein
MCQNNLSDAAFNFYRVDPTNPNSPGGDARSGEQYVVTGVQHDARAVFLPAVQDEGLLLPAVQDQGLLLPAVQDQGLLLPAVQDDGLLLPAVQDQWLL